jgi:hypothetical protein
MLRAVAWGLWFLLLLGTMVVVLLLVPNPW